MVRERKEGWGSREPWVGQGQVRIRVEPHPKGSQLLPPRSVGPRTAQPGRSPQGCGQAHKDMQELKQSLVCKDVEHGARDRVQDRQAVDPVLDEGVDSFKQAAEVGAVGLGEIHPPPQPLPKEDRVSSLPWPLQDEPTSSEQRSQGRGLLGARRRRWVARDTYLLLGEMETRGLKQP